MGHHSSFSHLRNSFEEVIFLALRFVYAEGLQTAQIVETGIFWAAGLRPETLAEVARMDAYMELPLCPFVSTWLRGCEPQTRWFRTFEMFPWLLRCDSLEQGSREKLTPLRATPRSPAIRFSAACIEMCYKTC